MEAVSNCGRRKGNATHEVRFSATLIFFVFAFPVSAQSWPQWGRTPQHDNVTTVAGRSLDFIRAEMVLDPFVATEIAQEEGELGVHYAVPLADGNDVFLVSKSGSLEAVQFRLSHVVVGRSLRGTPLSQIFPLRRSAAERPNHVTRIAFRAFH